jgi:hypothetical protein
MKQPEIAHSDFAAAMKAIWSEMGYQDTLERRTDDEATSVPAFLSLLRRYLRQTEDVWADRAGVIQPDGQTQVTEALDGLRKLAAIAVRAMIYNGVRPRE